MPNLGKGIIRRTHYFHHVSCCFTFESKIIITSSFLHQFLLPCRVILSILATLTLLSTILDYFYYSQSKYLPNPGTHLYNESNLLLATLNPLVKAFSARVNCRFLFQIVETRTNPNVIDCLHGIRCLSFIWVVFGHDYLVYLFSPNLNYVDMHWVSFFRRNMAIFIEYKYVLSVA